MANVKNTRSKSNKDDDTINKTEIKDIFKEANKNPAVKEALKKEKQPVTPDDLSPLHNTREIGTSGGDQRASENQLNDEEESL